MIIDHSFKFYFWQIQLFKIPTFAEFATYVADHLDFLHNSTVYQVLTSWLFKNILQLKFFFFRVEDFLNGLEKWTCIGDLYISTVGLVHSRKLLILYFGDLISSKPSFMECHVRLTKVPLKLKKFVRNTFKLKKTRIFVQHFWSNKSYCCNKGSDRQCMVNELKMYYCWKFS